MAVRGKTYSNVQAMSVIPIPVKTLSGYPRCAVAVRTGSGLTSFIAPSRSRNSAATALRTRPVQSTAFELFACCGSEDISGLLSHHGKNRSVFSDGSSQREAGQLQHGPDFDGSFAR